MSRPSSRPPFILLAPTVSVMVLIALACTSGGGKDDTGATDGTDGTDGSDGTDDPGHTTSTAGPEHCGQISEDEVWAADMVHVITCDVYVEGAVLSIGPGTEIQVENNLGLLVSYSGSAAGLMVDGRGSDPVRFHGADQASAGTWAGISIYGASQPGQLSLSHTSIEDAGGYGADAALGIADIKPLIGTSAG